MKNRPFFLPTTTINWPGTALGRIIPALTIMLPALTIMLPALTIMLLALGLSSPAAHAQTYSEQTVYAFTGGNTDGFGPYDGLIAGNLNGTKVLYGTTMSGGTYNEGTVFAIAPPTGAETILHSFGPFSSNDGGDLFASLTLLNGILYGVTELGGKYNEGTIFSVDPATGAEKTRYSFAGNLDGAYPVAGLVALNGVLYGTTLQGGDGYGTIFSYDPSTQGVNPIYLFQGGTTDGNLPQAGLVAVNGILYGTTLKGGSSFDAGMVYSFDPSTKIETILHTFTGSSLNHDGSAPQASLIEVNGILYGTTETGGRSNYGTVFSIHPDGNSYLILYSFTDAGDDGASPFASLTYDSLSGKLFGTTYSGGNASYGTVFSWDPVTQKEATIYSFTPIVNKYYNADGARPYGSLVDVDGTLYGTAYLGGTSGNGTVFSLTPVVLPIAKNDSGRGIANHTITVTAPGVLGNDNNGGDPKTTAAVVTNPTHGTLAFNSDGSFTYKPAPNFVGNDSFTYKDTNAAGTSNTATCTIAIGPIAYNDAGRTYFNTAVTINAPGVLGNDITGGIATTTSLVTSPTHGTITFNTDGSFKYTPTNGFVGTDSFTYQIINGAGTSAPATCTLTVQARTPIAVSDHGTVTHNTTATFAAPAVLGNDNPGTTGTVTASLVTNVSHGTLTLNSSGGFVYKPTTGFIGTDSFTYKDTNSVGTSNTATCTLTVQ